jgi:hypothetical protein
MTIRVFLNVKRGMTDATAVCVYPWEKRLLEAVHGQDVQEVTIEQLSELKDGVIKKEKVKFKYEGRPGPDLRQQLEAMAYVDPEEDPTLDPAAEYGRLADKYGMDKDLPIPVVTRIYGEFESGAFEKVLADHAKERMPKPTHLKAADEGLLKAPNKMNVGELREALTARGVEWESSEGKKDLLEKLEGALVE